MASPESESRNLSEQDAESGSSDKSKEAVTVMMVSGNEEDPFAFIAKSDEEGKEEQEPEQPDHLDDVDEPPACQGCKTRMLLKLLAP